MTALADACADLAAALPRAQALTHIPDTDGTTSRSAPGSRPPWNPAAATALLDALEGARQLEASWRSGVVRPMRVTGAVLASIVRLSYAMTETDQRMAVVAVTRWTTAILQLPAVDTEERPQRVAADCPYCGFGMLRVYPRSGRVTCLRFGACADNDGNHPLGHAGRSALNGDPVVTWQDGLVT